MDNHISGSDVSVLVRKLTAGKPSRNEKAQAILEYLDKEVRYTGIEFGEAAIVPHSPSETLTHKYGDCKDKATLLVAMLRTAGIPAYLALLNAGSRMDVPEDLPGMGLFDHAIVFVPGDPDLWIDATDGYAKLGQLPASDQGRMALIVRSGSDSLVRTAETPSQSNVLLELREIYLSENGPARIVETSQPQGVFESEYRSFYADKQNKNHRENLTSYVKSQYLSDKLDRLDRRIPAISQNRLSWCLNATKPNEGLLIWIARLPPFAWRDCSIGCPVSCRNGKAKTNRMQPSPRKSVPRITNYRSRLLPSGSTRLFHLRDFNPNNCRRM